MNCKYVLEHPKSNKWYIDSGCSRHMTGDQSKFVSIKSKDGGKVTFGGNQTGKIAGIGKIGNKEGLLIKDVYLGKDFATISSCESKY